MNIKEKKKFRSERSISIILAEEIVREEIKKLFSQIRFIYFDTKATGIQKRNDEKTRTNEEKDDTRERYVTIDAVFTTRDPQTLPFTVYSDLRLYKIEEINNTRWECHFLNLKIVGVRDVKHDLHFVYETGVINGLPNSCTTTNPCK